MVADQEQSHAKHTTEGAKMRSDHLAGRSTTPSEDADQTSEAVKIRSDGLSQGGSSASDVDDTDEATKMQSAGLGDTTPAGHSTSTEAEKMESDGLH